MAGETGVHGSETWSWRREAGGAEGAEGAKRDCGHCGCSSRLFRLMDLRRVVYLSRGVSRWFKEVLE